MKNRLIPTLPALAALVAALLLAIAPLPALAQTSESALVARIEAEGFTLVERHNSWLGRVVLEFRAGFRERQVIYDPVQGVILRDYWEEPREGEGFWRHWFGFHSEADEHGSEDGEDHGEDHGDSQGSEAEGD